MRKAELRRLSVTSEVTEYIPGQENVDSIEINITIYKAMQWRWEDGQTADPQTDDESYHLTESEAIEAADTISLDLGFRAQVDRITIDYSEINESIEFREEFELSDLDNYRRFNGDYETIYEGATNDGNELNGDSIVIMYHHHRYMNYAYTIERVCFVRETDIKTEADLVDDSDSLNTTYCTVLPDLDELAEAFRLGQYVPFNKVNSGSRIVREFLAENGHPDFVEVEETEDDE